MVGGVVMTAVVNLYSIRCTGAQYSPPMTFHCFKFVEVRIIFVVR